MAEHELKTWPEPFEAMWRGDKTAEFRKDDREPRFREGDTLRLHEWDPETKGSPWPLRTITCRVSDVRRGGPFGIPEGYAMLSVMDIERFRDT